MTHQTPFIWECHPKSEAFVQSVLDKAIEKSSDVTYLQKQLLEQTSTRLFDWLDHIVVGYTEATENQLREMGFVVEDASTTSRTFAHPGAQLPRIVVRDQDPSFFGLAVSVESIADFLMVRGRCGWIEGSPYSGYRRCLVSTENDVSLWVVERRGTLAMEPIVHSSETVEKYLDAFEKWATAPRQMSDEEEAFKRLIMLAEEIVESLGQDLAAWVILEVERKYWQARNWAGVLQKGRQDRVGMGWANHDHHTFRSSRRYFAQLVALFEILGFHCRERFYAGAEAGWGAQVMENPRAKLILFLDVDLDPSEIAGDFAHQVLDELPQLGTIGLWCALHGDSILKAGMHHLEAQFLFEELTQDLQQMGLQMMKPFSHFPHLKQAFTVGEIWTVDAQRIQALLRQNKITAEQADRFMQQGAVGSHLENLQRREGYKGFNQKNVSSIIKQTDPRTLQS